MAKIFLTNNASVTVTWFEKSKAKQQQQPHNNNINNKTKQNKIIRYDKGAKLDIVYKDRDVRIDTLAMLSH